jgi:glycerophosphoryl diester phosphodiesterase
VIVVAHRGASGTRPENTRAALVHAASLGAPWAEVDVQRTSDGTLILVHDDTWERTGGLARAVRDVAWHEVRALDIGAWFDARYAGERVLTLAQTLDWARTSGVRLDLEIKSPEYHPGLGPEVAQAVLQSGLADRVLLTCFDPAVIDAVATEYPALECGYLADRGDFGRHPRVRTYVLHAGRILADPASCLELQRAGGHVWAWTVDDPSVVAALRQAGVEAIVTNYPERFLPPRA